MTPGFFAARRLTAPAKERDFNLTILESTSDSIALKATPKTTMPGQWGLFYWSGGHVTISGVPVIHGKTVTWPVVRGTPPPKGTAVSWSGIVRPTPGSAGLVARDSHFRTPAGDIPAWFIGAQPGDRRPVWAVHLHGLGSTRAGALRGVWSMNAAGAPSVVPTYRNTREGPKTGHGRSHLGQTETEDIEAVLEKLSVTGEERFILFGWSMGAQIALRLATDARWGSRVDRLVLDSPVLCWRRTMELNVREAGFPAIVGRGAGLWLSKGRPSRLVGLDEPLDLDAMDWVARAAEVTQPTLVLHSTQDRFVPHSASVAFTQAAARAELVSTAGGHTTGWNADPLTWHNAVSTFLVSGEL